MKIIDKIVAKYLEKKGYVAYKKYFIDYVDSFMDVTKNEIDRYYEGGQLVKDHMTRDIREIQSRFKYDRLK